MKEQTTVPIQGVEDHWRDDVAALNGDLTAAAAPPPIHEEVQAGRPNLLPNTYSIVIVMEEGPYDPHVAARPAELARDCHDSVIVTIDPQLALIPVTVANRLQEAWQHGNPCRVVAHPQSHTNPTELLNRIRPLHPAARLDPPVPWAAHRLPGHLDLRRGTDPVELKTATALPDNRADVPRLMPEGQLAMFRRDTGPEWLVAHLGTDPADCTQWAWTPLPAEETHGVAGGEALWDWRTGRQAELVSDLGEVDPQRDPWLYHAVAAGLRGIWHPARARMSAHCGYHYCLPSLEAWLLTHVPAWSWTEHLHFAAGNEVGENWELLSRPRLEDRIRGWTVTQRGNAA